MNTKTTLDLGRHAFESTWAIKSSPGFGANDSGTNRRVLVAPGQVQYAPYSVPGYKLKIALGQDATSLLIGRKFKEVEGTRFKSRTLFGYPGNNQVSQVVNGELFSLTGSLPFSAPASLPLAYALASEKFLADYFAKSHSVRGASAIAEGLQTVRGLLSPAKALRKEVSNLYQSLRGRLYRAGGPASKDAAKVVGGTWLEWNFGLKPLASDVNGAADAYNKMASGDFRATLPLRGSGVQEAITDTLVNQGISQPGGIFIGVHDRYIMDQTIVTNRGAIRVANPGGELPLAMQWGVGFEDIAPAVWEGIPWSWFADYFFNISSLIDAWSSGLYSRLTWSNQTVRNSKIHLYSDLRPIPDDTFGATYQRYQVSGGHVKASFTFVTRSTVDPRSLAPPFRLRLPQFGTKWANLTALAAMKANPFKGDVDWNNVGVDSWKPVRGVRGGRWYYK